jgi:hypothetical protein
MKPAAARIMRTIGTTTPAIMGMALLWGFVDAPWAGDVVGDAANVGSAGSPEEKSEEPGDFSELPERDVEAIVVDWVRVTIAVAVGVNVALVDSDGTLEIEDEDKEEETTGGILVSDECEFGNEVDVVGGGSGGEGGGAFAGPPGGATVGLPWHLVGCWSQNPLPPHHD